MRTEVQAGVSVPFTYGKQPQEAGVLPNSSCEAFEMPWKNYCLSILTEQMDASCVLHEKKNELVHSSQNCDFLQWSDPLISDPQACYAAELLEHHELVWSVTCHKLPRVSCVRLRYPLSFILHRQ